MTHFQHVLYKSKCHLLRAKYVVTNVTKRYTRVHPLYDDGLVWRRLEEV